MLIMATKKSAEDLVQDIAGLAGAVAGDVKAGKNPLMSKTLWVGGLAIVGGVLVQQGYIDATSWDGIGYVALGVIGIGLRFITNEPVDFSTWFGGKANGTEGQ